MKKTLKFAAVAASAALALGMTACNNGGYDMNETDEDIKSITILSINWNEFNTAAQANTPVYQALKNAIGCDIKAESVADNQLDSTIDLRRADEDLPEMFRIFGPYKSRQYESLIREGDIVAISDYVNENTKDEYPYLYEHMKYFDYMKSNVSYANGKIYFVPCRWGNEKSLWVRTDWIDNLNKKLDQILVQEGVVSSTSQVTEELRQKHQYVLPDTLPEFYRLARAFTLYDPDGDGKNNTVGYMTENNRDFDSWMYIACDTGWKQWMQDKNPLTGETVNAGQYVFSNATEGSKIATSIFNKMYKEKYISSDSVHSTTEDKHKAFFRGTAGMMYAHNWYNYHLREMTSIYENSLEGSDLKEKFQSCMKMVASIDVPAGINGAHGGHSPYSSCYLPGPAINARMSEARIKKCLKLLEYFYSPAGQDLMFYGVEGVDYEKDADGGIVNLHKEDQYGLTYRLTEYDYASRLTYVIAQPIETERITTNGELVVSLAERSQASQCFSDYLDIVTTTAKNYLSQASNYFDEETWNMMLKSEYAADWKFDERTWASDGWSKLYTVSNKFNAAWQSFRETYNDGYKGDIMQEEYNDFIASGKAQKRPGLA